MGGQNFKKVKNLGTRFPGKKFQIWVQIRKKIILGTKFGEIFFWNVGPNEKNKF